MVLFIDIVCFCKKKKIKCEVKIDVNFRTVRFSIRYDKNTGDFVMVLYTPDFGWGR